MIIFLLLVIWLLLAVVFRLLGTLSGIWGPTSNRDHPIVRGLKYIFFLPATGLFLLLGLVK